jgi:hypothetical protein
MAVDTLPSVPMLSALPGTALLLAYEGAVECAVGLYVLASRYPYVSNSSWYEDIAGQHIAAIASTLPSNVVTAARDLEATVSELLEELERE